MRVLIIAMSLFALIASAEAETVNNPYSNYLSEGGFTPDGELYAIAIEPVPNQRFLLISHSGASDGKAGNIWTVYEQHEDSYTPLEGSISFRMDALAFTKTDGIDGLTLVSYWPINADRGTLQAFLMKDGKISSHNLGTIEPAGKDKDRYQNLFENDALKVFIDSRPIQDFLVSEVNTNANQTPIVAGSLVDDTRGYIVANSHATPMSPQVGSDAVEPEQPHSKSSAKPWVGYLALVAGGAMICLAIINRTRRA